MTKIDEAALTGANRYFTQSQAHSQAGLKYKTQAKHATTDPESAKKFRKVGKLHDQISQALQQIAGIHTSHEHSNMLAQKDAKMATKPIKEDIELIDEETNWDLYRDHPDHNKAHKAIEKAWNHAKTLKTAHGAEDHVSRVMKKYKHVGATDTEPRHVLHNKLTNHFGSEYKRKSFYDTDHRGKYLAEGEDNMDINEAYENALDDLVGSALEGRVVDFAETMGTLIQSRALEAIEDMKVSLAQEVFNDVQEGKTFRSDDEDGEEKKNKFGRRRFEKKNKRAYNDVDESTEQVDEISKKTLGSYIKKGSQDLADKGHEMGVKKAEASEIERFTNRHGKNGSFATRDRLQKDGGSDMESDQKRRFKFVKRSQGISKATDRLTKEDVDQVDELHGKGSLNKIMDYHDRAGSRHDPDSNAGDYHTAQAERGHAIRDRVDAKKKLDAAKERAADFRGYTRERKRLLKKDGPGAPAREID